MDLRFGTQNKSPYRAGSLMTVIKEMSKCTLDLLGYRKSDGTEMAPNQQANIHVSMERGMRMIN
jgi:hypothetical protein